MDEMKFFRRTLSPTLAEIVEWTGAKPAPGVDLAQTIVDVAPLDRARPGDLVFLDNPKYVGQLAHTRATACLIGEKY
uniref:LpxD N-terminal domain-containing protein n=1 Tax=Rhodoblastus sp. TaxID=1962975 RepID=UPI003F9B636B